MTIQDKAIGKQFLDLIEASLYTGASTTTLRRAVRSKALAHHRFGTSETRGKILIRVTDLEKFIGKNRHAASS